MSATIKIGSIVPNFKVDSTEGPLEFHSWLDLKPKSWCVFFNHPSDFTPVCTSEFSCAARLQDHFEARNTRLLGLSRDPVEKHVAWQKDISKVSGEGGAAVSGSGASVMFPILSDVKGEVEELFGMCDISGKSIRAVYVIDPRKRVRLIMFYPPTCGRSYDEILRCLDSLQLTDNQALFTPANWKLGDKAIVPPEVSTDEAVKKYHGDLEIKTDYLRLAPTATVTKEL